MPSPPTRFPIKATLWFIGLNESYHPEAGLQTKVSGDGEDGQQGELAAEDEFAGGLEPALEDGGVHAAEIDVVHQVAVVEVRQARVLAEGAGLYRAAFGLATISSEPFAPCSSSRLGPEEYTRGLAGSD